ncbi:Uncharacterised protein [uncultured archaeon]|nr:Uncharacterised protein [uncultured archaeon]
MKDYKVLMLVLFLFSVAGLAQMGEGQQMPETGPVSMTTEGKIITLADDGKTISLKTNETFLLQLGEEYEWNITIDDQTVLSRVVGVLVVRGAQGIYKAHTPGRAILTAVGDPICRKSIPPCAAPSREFRLNVVVSGNPETTPTPFETPKAPGFGFIVSLVGLLTSLFLKRHRNE